MKKIVLSIILILIAAAGIYAYYSYAVKHISNEVSEIKHASIAVSGKTLEFDYPVFKDWNVKVYDNRIEYKPKPVLGMIPVFQPASSIEIDAVDLPEGYSRGGVWPSVNGFGVGYEAYLEPGINMNVLFESGFSFSRGFGSYANQIGFDYKKVLETIAGSFHEKSPIADTVKTQKISISGCIDPFFCEFDIIMSIDGVSDKRIIEINNEMTGFIFEDDESNPIDIRIAQNRIIPKKVREVSLESLDIKILYADTDIVGYRRIVVGDDDFIDSIDYGPRVVFVDEKKRDFISQEYTRQILDYFYPNYEDTFSSLLTEDLTYGLKCLQSEDFPDSYEPTLIPSEKTVSYGILFNNSSRVCRGEFETLDISIPELLKEFPQYVPKDSLLWKFAI